MLIGNLGNASQCKPHHTLCMGAESLGLALAVQIALPGVECLPAFVAERLVSALVSTCSGIRATWLQRRWRRATLFVTIDRITRSHWDVVHDQQSTTGAHCVAMSAQVLAVTLPPLHPLITRRTDHALQLFAHLDASPSPRSDWVHVFAISARVADPGDTISDHCLLAW